MAVTDKMMMSFFVISQTPEVTWQYYKYHSKPKYHLRH